MQRSAIGSTVHVGNEAGRKRRKCVGVLLCNADGRRSERVLRTLSLLIRPLVPLSVARHRRRILRHFQRRTHLSLLFDLWPPCAAAAVPLHSGRAASPLRPSPSPKTVYFTLIYAHNHAGLRQLSLSKYWPSPGLHVCLSSSPFDAN